jgi:CBS domain containing-hemolysin-like protein
MIYLPIIFLSLAMAGFLSGAEIGMLSANRVKIRHLKEEGVPWAVAAYEILNNIHRFVAAMIVGVNLSIVTASCLATSLFTKNLLFVEIGLSGFVLVFCEVIPKAVFRRYSTALLQLLFLPITAFYRLFLPATFLVGWIKPKRGVIGRSEIVKLMEEGKKEGVIEEGEEDMVSGVFQLSEKRAYEVMTPRKNIVAVSAETPLHKVISLIEKEGFSRIPVYDDTPDEIIGILYAKDILRFWNKNSSVSAAELMRFAHFVPEQARVNQLLSQFRKERCHIAIVVDEYGGTSGLITLEDLLEEIVGEIQDEFDLEESPVKELRDGEYLVDGQAEVELLIEEFGIKLYKREQFETISGLILDRLGRIPAEGENIEVEGLVITIDKADEKGIYRVRIKECMP